MNMSERGTVQVELGENWKRREVNALGREDLGFFIPTTSFDFPLCMPLCIRHDSLSIYLIRNVPQLL